MAIFDLEAREALIGRPTVSVSENPTGNVLERLAYIANSISIPTMRYVAMSIGVPPLMSDPVDRTITENTTFEDDLLHYYRNLTIAPGVTVKLRNGPMIIVVEGDLTIGEGAVIDGNGLGGKGGAAGTSYGQGGYGGNIWDFDQRAIGGIDADDPNMAITNGHLVFTLRNSNVSIVYAPDRVLAFALFGFQNNTPLTAPGAVNGIAWQELSFWGITGFNLLLYRALVIAILSRMTYDPTYGGVGGGGGGGGVVKAAGSLSVPAAYYFAGKGSDGDADGEPGTGGLGFGGGGSGGTCSSDGPDGSIAGGGGDGGGTQLWIVRRINNAGIVRSDGTPGGAASTSGGSGGGGGGGGCAALLYMEAVGAGVGTWQANGGEGGAAPNASGYPGGNGGAGMVKITQLVL